MGAFLAWTTSMAPKDSSWTMDPALKSSDQELPPTEDVLPRYLVALRTECYSVERAFNPDNDLHRCT